MKYIVAVSGGVDSVVLLDMMIKNRVNHRFIVAHFDHGIREDSAADARFVEALAARYNIRFESRREELTVTSESHARERRYRFLKDLAKKYDARIVTAHHQDDLVETIAINFVRGTGWRGLAVFGDTDIIRPLIAKSKKSLYEYAIKHNLEWVEDETNTTDLYLRNRIRKSLARQTELELSKKLHLLQQSQTFLRSQIVAEALRYQAATSRYFFIMLPETVALELLRLKTDSKLTKPQLTRLLHAIKTAKSGSQLVLGAGVTALVGQRDFAIKNTS